jgi:prepilin-type processing-associated H-X9-DG protein
MNGDGDGTSLSNSAADANAQRVQDMGSGRTRHLEGANYAYVDGHVKWLKPEVTLSGTTGCDFQTNGVAAVNAPTGSTSTFCAY